MIPMTEGSARAELARQVAEAAAVASPMATMTREEHLRCASLSNSILELIVLPTEQCNFRCTYCYEDFEIGHMPEAVVDGVVNLLDRRGPKLKYLQLSYFGGEPLLNMKAIRRISGKGKDLEQRYGTSFFSGATTNGYLLDNRFLTELLSLNCTQFQVSLDGWGEVHDATRRRRNQAGSFDRIWTNLLAARDSGLAFTILLRVHLMPGNEASTMRLIEEINREFDDERFEVILKKVGNWGGRSADHPEVYEDGAREFASFYRTIKAMVNRVSDQGAEEVGGGAPASPAARRAEDIVPASEKLPYVCYASKGNSLVVRANGRLNKCTVALTSGRNDIGRINADGTIAVDADKLAPWLTGLATMDEAYMGCPASRVLTFA